MEPEEICFLSAGELASAYRRRELSPIEVLEAVLARIEAVDSKINAYCALDAERARADARAAEARLRTHNALGPLDGVPISIKDVVFTKGIRTTRGSALWADFVPEADSPVVERVRAGGAVVLGKTNTPELGWKGATDNLVFGATRNPWDLSRTPGGSSGGSAAALAAGLGPLSIGTDGAGSIRIPASFCGVVGLKPSFGRVPYYPPSAASAIAHIGPMARTVADAALVLALIAGPDERDPSSLEAAPDGLASSATGEVRGLRVAWCPSLGQPFVDPEVRALTTAAARRFEVELGCVVEELEPNFTDPVESVERLFYGALAVALEPYWDTSRDRIDQGLVRAVERVRGLGALDLARAGQARVAVWECLRPIFERHEVLLTPTLPAVAFALGVNSPLEAAGQQDGLAWTPFTYPFNLTGQPAISVPCGWTVAGLPVGLQIVGRRYADAAVLRAAAAYERVAPWRDRRPPL